MSLQFIRHSVYTRGLKNFKNRNIPDAGKARQQQQQQALYINPRCVFRVVSNIPHWGGFWPKIWLSVWFALYI